MKVSDKMTRNIVSVESSASARDAARKMESENVGTVLVTDDGRLVGLVTDRQIAIKVVAGGADPESMKVKEFMTRDVVTSSPDMDICEAARRMGDLGFRRMPVVEGDRAVGVLSVADIAEHARGCNLCTEGVMEEISKSAR